MGTVTLACVSSLIAYLRILHMYLHYCMSQFPKIKSLCVYITLVGSVSQENPDSKIEELECCC